MMHAILTAILALAVIVLAVLLCAMRKRMAKTEQYFNSALVLHNRRMWAVYELLRKHVRMTSHVQASQGALQDMDMAFNKKAEQ